MSSGAPEKADEIAKLLISGKGYEVVGDEELQQATIQALTAMKPETLTKTIQEADFGSDKKPTAFTAYAGENKVAVYLPVEHAVGDVATILLTFARDRVSGRHSEHTGRNCFATTNQPSKFFSSEFPLIESPSRE